MTESPGHQVIPPYSTPRPPRWRALRGHLATALLSILLSLLVVALAAAAGIFSSDTTTTVVVTSTPSQTAVIAEATASPTVTESIEIAEVVSTETPTPSPENTAAVLPTNTYTPEATPEAATATETGRIALDPTSTPIPPKTSTPTFTPVPTENPDRLKLEQIQPAIGEIAYIGSQNPVLLNLSQENETTPVELDVIFDVSAGWLIPATSSCSDSIAADEFRSSAGKVNLGVYETAYCPPVTMPDEPVAQVTVRDIHDEWVSASWQIDLAQETVVASVEQLFPVFTGDTPENVCYRRSDNGNLEPLNAIPFVIHLQGDAASSQLYDIRFMLEEGGSAALYRLENEAGGLVSDGLSEIEPEATGEVQPGSSGSICVLVEAGILKAVPGSGSLPLFLEVLSRAFVPGFSLQGVSAMDSSLVGGPNLITTENTPPVFSPFNALAKVTNGTNVRQDGLNTDSQRLGFLSVDTVVEMTGNIVEVGGTQNQRTEIHFMKDDGTVATGWVPLDWLGSFVGKKPGSTDSDAEESG